jgi:hypothetical protein
VNLYDMLRRNDPDVVASGGVAIAKGDIEGERWRGVHLSGPARLEIVDARRFYSLRGQPDSCGWRVRVPQGAVFEIGFLDPTTKRTLSPWRQPATSAPVPVRIPWPKTP